MIWKMPTASSRIWTRVAVFISYDDNHHTTVISLYICIYVCVCVCVCVCEKERERIISTYNFELGDYENHDDIM